MQFNTLFRHSCFVFLFPLTIAHSLLRNGVTWHAVGQNVHITCVCVCVSGAFEGCIILISLMHRVLQLNYLCHAYWRDPCPILWTLHWMNTKSMWRATDSKIYRPFPSKLFQVAKNSSQLYENGWFITAISCRISCIVWRLLYWWSDAETLKCPLGSSCL